MLKLTDIKKSYKTYDFVQMALDGVSITFRDNEFAAVLGPSGSGKTTMLNIIGGLDHYDDGDLEVDGVSTKQYKSSDWDTYRNNRIGFVFQSYNLIPHQTVLANVELALTLSGVSRAERKQRAIEALERVGLEEHIRKLPSQLSGGQMQRVAIARALINDPEIVLADEPTGALDTQTSKQVMNLLTEIAKDRLVIMVTHNSELAEEYANRIIHLRDGKVTSDSNPCDPTVETEHLGRKIRKASMSFWTAVSLSFSNLMTKKGRTLVTALAGSIGIIGIAAILALANGINDYIKNIEQETMSIYPLTIQSSGFDLSSMFISGGSDDEEEVVDGVKEMAIVESLFSYRRKNDLQNLKEYIDSNNALIDPYVHTIQYTYDITPQIYLADTENGVDQIHPDSIFESYGLGSSSGMASLMSNFSGMSGGMEIFTEMPNNRGMYEYQYEVVAGHWPENYDEVVIVLSQSGMITDYELYSMGLRDRSELKAIVEAFMNNTDADIEIKNDSNIVPYETLLGVQFKVINPADTYQYDDNYDVWVDKSTDKNHMKAIVDDGLTLKVVGVVKADPGITATTLTSGINYTPELITYLMDEAAKTEIVKAQLEDPTVNVLSGKTFVEENEGDDDFRFNFSDVISINEKAIANAFKIDTSKFNIDLSGLSNITIDFSSVSLPDIDINALLQSIAGQLNIPTDQLVVVVESVLADFLAEETAAGVTDPDQLAIDFTAYIQRPDVQANINAQLSGIIDPTQLQSEITKALEKAMQGIMQSYVSQIMGTLQSQIEGVMTGAMAQLPAQMQSAVSIDTQAFASAFKLNMSEDDLLNLMTSLMSSEESTYERNLNLLGYAESSNPSQISIYPLDFDSKQEVTAFLDGYNTLMQENDELDKVVSYTDLVGTLMKSVTEIVNLVSYALIAFVAISLIVSSIMIGVITYISVLERKKEIGILRAIGASKKSIRQVFNAETLIIGFVAGVLGIGVTYLISMLANVIIYNALGVPQISKLPLVAAMVLIGISMFLTFIAGLFPSSAAARKDPVEALRSE